jgi:hypothetical protein
MEQRVFSRGLISFFSITLWILMWDKNLQLHLNKLIRQKPNRTSRSAIGRLRTGKKGQLCLDSSIYLGRSSADILFVQMQIKTMLAVSLSYRLAVDLLTSNVRAMSISSRTSSARRSIPALVRLLAEALPLRRYRFSSSRSSSFNCVKFFPCYDLIIWRVF